MEWGRGYMLINTVNILVGIWYVEALELSRGSFML